MMKNKYNAKSIKIDEFIFDSEIEGKMYLLLKKWESIGLIRYFSLHPAFLLLEPFEYKGKKEKGISYKADFKVCLNDGTIKIIEIKGYVARDFPLRLKLFKSRYPNFDIVVLAECPKIDADHAWGESGSGFIELDKLTKLRAARKRANNAKKKAKQTKKGTTKSKKS